MRWSAPELGTTWAQTRLYARSRVLQVGRLCPCVNEPLISAKSTHRISQPPVCCQELGAYWVWLWLHDSTRPERSVTVISTFP